MEAPKNALFDELIESLKDDVIVCSKIESAQITQLFKEIIPITYWGKVDWNQVEKKVDLNNNENIIIPTLERLITHQVKDDFVYVEWSEASIPVLKANLSQLIKNFEKLTKVDFEQFIFNPQKGYLIEIKPDTITIGFIPKLLTQWKIEHHIS